ncbi:MAG: pyridoxamine 5'-phosphate oxidase [Actinomycetota bacterium]|nr:pyridoxamine 5'-phosphate oxidase [Actinomycetota bacterium]
MDVHAELAALRAEYRQRGLDEDDLDPDPLVAFRQWFDQAAAAGLPEPNAMVLATTGPGGRPAARTVLLKGVDPRGFRFFTNYGSAKGRHLAVNPACALVFLWQPLARQVCVAGRAERLSREESIEYFASRPRGSRLGAWASRQSEVVPSREVLDRRLAELEQEYEGSSDIPLPPFWGGYVVVPDSVELWQGRPNRLHDRLRYLRAGPGEPWRIERLSP